MQQSLSLEPLPQHASHAADDCREGFHSSGEPAHHTCGAFDPLTGCLLLGCSSGSVSCLHLGQYGSTARRVLGQHAGRVTGSCLFPWKPPQHVSAAASVVPCARAASFFATCSADATIKLWTSDAKALHSTDACLQTLRGHRSAVTSLAAVQVAHTWCLLSGGTDGQLLLWRSVLPAEAAHQQLSGAAMLAQLVPHLQLTEAPLFTSPHWITWITCAAQQPEAGMAQGAFLVLPQQPVLQVPISRAAVCDTAAGVAASAAAAEQQVSCPGSQLLAVNKLAGPPSLLLQAKHQQSGSRLGRGPGSGSALHMQQVSSIRSSSSHGGAHTRSAASSTCCSPHSTGRALHRPGTASHVSSSGDISSCSPGSATGSAPGPCELPGTQQLSILMACFVQQQLAVATLSYDGACRVHSVAEGVTRCCWRSPTGSNYVAMDVSVAPQGGQLMLLGDDRGSLHLYSLDSEQLLATKQLAGSLITAVVSCGRHSPGDHSCSNGSVGSSGGGGKSSNQHGSCVLFAVMSQDSVGLWQLQQGCTHGMVPGGHRQGIIALQLCSCDTTGLFEGPLNQPALPPPPQLSRQNTFPSTVHTTLASALGGSSQSPDSRCENGTAGREQSMLFSAGLDGMAIQWDLSGVVPKATQAVLATAGAEDKSEMTATAYLQGSAILATGHDNGQILLWHMDTASHVQLGPQAHSNTVSCLAPVITGKGDEQLLSGGFDGWVCLWEPRQVRGVKPHLLSRFQAHGCSSAVSKLLTPPLQQDGQQVPAAASASSCREPRLAGQPRTAGRALGQPAVRVQIATSCLHSAGTSLQPTAPIGRSPARPHSSTRQAQNSSCSPRSRAVPDAALLAVAAEAPEVTALVFEPINQVIITAGNDSLIKVWSGAATGTLLGQHAGHTGPVTCLTLDGNLLFSGSIDTTIRMWDACPGTFISGYHQQASVPAAALAGQGGCGGVTAAVGGSCGAPAPGLPHRSVARGRAVACCAAFSVLRGHAAAVTGLAVAADSGVLVSCGADGLVLQWDYSTGQLLARSRLSSAGLSCVAVEPDTQQVYVGTVLGQLLTLAGTDQKVAVTCDV